MNLDEWSDKLQTLKDASNFLVEVVKEPVALEIKNQVLMINQRFGDVKSEIGKFMQQQSLQQSQQTYQEGVTRLRQWLDGAEGMLRSHATCTLKDLRELMRQLDVCIMCSFELLLVICGTVHINAERLTSKGAF